jgi:hypothetical protein
MTPLAPVHLAGRRLPDGEVLFEWVRRGRVDADGWQAVEIPLDEPFERYRIDILDGETIRRSAEIDAPAFTYVAAEQMADFGGLPGQIEIRVRQLGRKVAEGLPAQSLITF